VAAVSEAAEKYEVFAAMPICNVHMRQVPYPSNCLLQSCSCFLRQFIADHAADVLAYALKHDYPSLVDQIAPTLVTRPLSSVLEKLPVNYMAPWVRSSLLSLSEALCENDVHLMNR
jgi:hypothetical protein